MCDSLCRVPSSSLPCHSLPTTFLARATSVARAIAQRAKRAQTSVYVNFIYHIGILLWLPHEVLQLQPQDQQQTRITRSPNLHQGEDPCPLPQDGRFPCLSPGTAGGPRLCSWPTGSSLSPPLYPRPSCSGGWNPPSPSS